MKLWSAIKNLFTPREMTDDERLADARRFVYHLRRGPVAHVKEAEVYQLGEVVICSDEPFFAVSQSLNKGDFVLIPIPEAARDGLRLHYGKRLIW